MSGVTEVHVERESLHVEVNLPGHEARVTTPLFRHSREALIEREGGRCWISGMTAEESGHPLEAHHFPIERSLANMTDWARFSRDAKAGFWGPYAKEFDWDKFFEGAQERTVHIPADHVAGVAAKTVHLLIPKDPYLFVDDMRVNGLLLAKPFHTGEGMGIHYMPHPLWVVMRYAIEGYQYMANLTIHHFEGDGH